MMTPTDEPARGDPRELIRDAVAALAAAGIENPRLDAELLLARAAGVLRVQIAAGDVALDTRMRTTFAGLITRRVAREPLAYILGVKEFYSLEFEVTPAVLIPRPDTETLVTVALAFLAERPAARVLDLGTGSGAIALTLATHAPHATVVAADLATDALVVARRNARRLGLTDRVIFRQTDCYDVRDHGDALGRFDLIVANPPYIADAAIATLEPEVARWEPRSALAGGPDGLAFYRRIARGLRNYLVSDGRLIVEIGAGQEEAITCILRDAGCARVESHRDLSGIVRVLSARR